MLLHRLGRVDEHAEISGEWYLKAFMDGEWPSGLLGLIGSLGGLRVLTLKDSSCESTRLPYVTRTAPLENELCADSRAGLGFSIKPPCKPRLLSNKMSHSVRADSGAGGSGVQGGACAAPPA
eukprot:1016313-Pelagomonas_calceolata.AAC.5